MRKIVLVLVGLAVVLALAGCGTKVPGVPSTVAKVNGTPIVSSDYLNELNQQYGKQVLRNMIEQEILLEWAKELGVPATQEQVNKQIENMKRNQEYTDRVKQAGESILKRQLMVQQAVTNIAVKIYKITDKDLQAAYDSPGVKQRYVHGPQKRIAAMIAMDKKRLDEAATKIKEGKDFDQVAAEYSVTGGVIKDWVNLEGANVPASLLGVIKGTPTGKVSQVFSLGGNPPYQQFAIIKVLAERPKADLKLKDVKPEVEQMAAMQKIQTSPDFQKKLYGQKKKAKIEVLIPNFESVGAMLKAPPQPSMGGMGQAPGP